MICNQSFRYLLTIDSSYEQYVCLCAVYLIYARQQLRHNTRLHLALCGFARLGDRIDLVEEDETRRIGLCACVEYVWVGAEG